MAASPTGRNRCYLGSPVVMFLTMQFAQLGAAVKTAQALGLRRDGSSMTKRQNMEPALVEYRRSYLYYADRSYVLVLGRPNSIQDNYTSTLPPSNIDDEPSPAHMRSPLPLSTPTRMTYVILRHQLAAIIGRMVHHLQQLRTTCHYSEVVALDDELQLLAISGDDSNLQYWEVLSCAYVLARLYKWASIVYVWLFLIERTTNKETGHLAAPSIAEKLCRHRRGEARDCP
ncbi:hypothetical protein C8J57DRAFT_1561319 [Mycena rebaudengoi]|nr:hypothetical protein C8J57DRAFT_1561319 [Mycena rebaudengoi]